MTRGSSDRSSSTGGSLLGAHRPDTRDTEAFDFAGRLFNPELDDVAPADLQLLEELATDDDAERPAVLADAGEPDVGHRRAHRRHGRRRYHTSDRTGKSETRRRPAAAPPGQPVRAGRRLWFLPRSPSSALQEQSKSKRRKGDVARVLSNRLSLAGSIT